MTCPVTSSHRIVLDPFVHDLDGETSRLRAAGPYAPIELPGEVAAWAVTDYEEARELLLDPRLVKSVDHWGAWQRGEIPSDWPLLGMVKPAHRSMFTEDGAEHRRLRAMTAQALTTRRVEQLRPRVEALTGWLLDELAAAGERGPVDFRSVFAGPLPMAVVSELMGVDPGEHDRLRELYHVFFSFMAPPERRQAVMAELDQFFLDVIADKKENPTDDLTGALIMADDGGEPLTDEELSGTLQAMIAAGHETTVSLLVNAVRALLTHPDQLRLVLAGEVSWEAVIEETLRWNTPTTILLLRFATEDIKRGDHVIARGDAVAIAYRAIGRDPQRHGQEADAFDITREPVRHMSFGYGPHICPGAALSRLEALVALPALFARFPRLTLAVEDRALTNLPVFTQNDLSELPVLLHGGAGS